MMHDRLKLLGWIALGLIAAALLGSQVLPIPFVTERRAAFNLEQAQAHLASGDFEQAKTEFRAVLRLQPANREARRQLAALKLPPS